MLDQPTKRMSPEEAADLFICNDNEPTHPQCPISEWCLAHVFEPDTCEETWRRYIAAQDAGLI